MKPRVAIWAAVSSKPQAADDKTSLQDQEDLGRQYAEKIGGEVVRIYKVPGHTRDIVFWHEAEAEMEAYRELRQDIEAGNFDTLWVLDLDRLGRDPALSNQVVSLVEKAARAFHLSPFLFLFAALVLAAVPGAPSASIGFPTPAPGAVAGAGSGGADLDDDAIRRRGLFSLNAHCAVNHHLVIAHVNRKCMPVRKAKLKMLSTFPVPLVALKLKLCHRLLLSLLVCVSVAARYANISRAACLADSFSNRCQASLRGDQWNP